MAMVCPQVSRNNPRGMHLGAGKGPGARPQHAPSAGEGPRGQSPWHAPGGKEGPKAWLPKSQGTASGARHGTPPCCEEGPGARQ